MTGRHARSHPNERTLRGGWAERLDVAAAVRVAARANAVGPLRAPALGADVQPRWLDLVLRAPLVAARLRGFLLGDRHGRGSV